MVYNASYPVGDPLIFVVKDPKPLLSPDGQRMKELFYQIAPGSDFTIQEMELDRNPIHLMVLTQPKLAPAQIVRRLKAESTRLIWQEHPQLKRQFWKKQIFWSDGYFCVSMGNASIETVLIGDFVTPKYRLHRSTLSAHFPEELGVFKCYDVGDQFESRSHRSIQNR